MLRGFALLKHLGLAVGFLIVLTACSGDDPADDTTTPLSDETEVDTELTSDEPVADVSSTADASTSTTLEETTTTTTTLVEVFVAVDGTDSNTGESAEAALATIGTALTRVEPGGEIFLEPGVYPPLELVNLRGTEDAPIRITALPGVEVRGTGYTADAGISVVESEHLQLRGFTVRQALWGIYVDDSHHLVLEGNDVADIGQEAVRIKNESSHVHIEGNRIADTGRRTDVEPNGEGIYLGTGTPGGVDAVDSITIVDNDLTGIRDEAIDVKRPVTNVEIRNNRISDVVTATSGAIVVHLNGDGPGDPNIVIEGNIIRNVTRSSPFFDGNCIVTQTTTRIVNNVLHGCQHRGIYVRGDAGVATILHNTFIDTGEIGVIISDERGMDILALNNLGLDQARNVGTSPGFVDASAGDYRPLPGSELASAPDVGVRTDLFGAPRTASPGVTYGAAETAPSEPSDG